MSRKLFFDPPKTDSIKDNERIALRDINIYSQQLEYDSDDNVYFKRETVLLELNEGYDADDLIATNSIVEDLNSVLIIPSSEIPTNTEEVEHSSFLKIVPKCNYNAKSYNMFMEEIDEKNIPSIYFNSKYEAFPTIPYYISQKNFEKPLTSERIKNFEDIESKYSPNDDLRAHNLVFGKSYDYSAHTISTEFPNVNKISVSYKPNEITKSYLFSNDPQDETNIYERLMILIGHHATDVGAVTDSGGHNLIEFQTIVNNYMDPMINDTEAKSMVMSYDFYLKPFSDPSHMVLLQNFMTSLTQNYFRSYEEIFMEEKCLNELFFFKVEKWAGPTELNEPIKTFLIPATSNFFEIHDTQIKEDRFYTYKITAYSFVMGSRYFFYNKQQQYGNQVSYQVDTYPSIKILETVLGKKTIINKSNPPLPPYISFHNKSASSKRIKIYMSTKFGYEQKKFTRIEKVDQNQFIANAEESVPTFEYSRDKTTFQIYRIDTKPTSYRDFANYKIGQFSDPNNFESIVVGDYLEPNKKYYYTFRALNSSFLASNPTSIYEVELLRDSNQSKIIVDTYDIEKDKKSLLQDNLPFRRLLQIMPASSQTEIGQVGTNELGDEADAYDTPQKWPKISEVPIGDENHAVWGRKLKIRIKSKNTGKVIDYNIKFNLIKDINEENFST